MFLCKKENISESHISQTIPLILFRSSPLCIYKHQHASPGILYKGAQLVCHPACLSIHYSPFKIRFALKNGLGSQSFPLKVTPIEEGRGKNEIAELCSLKVYTFTLRIFNGYTLWEDTLLFSILLRFWIRDNPQKNKNTLL